MYERRLRFPLFESFSVIRRLALLFIVLPALELFMLYLLMNALPFGMILTATLVVGTSVSGVLLAKRQGTSCWLDLHRHLDRGEAPTQPIANGILILAAAALLIAPGFLTDLAGILLLIPPIRRAVIAYALFRFEAHRRRRPTAMSPSGIIDV